MVRYLYKVSLSIYIWHLIILRVTQVGNINMTRSPNSICLLNISATFQMLTYVYLHEISMDTRLKEALVTTCI